MKGVWVVTLMSFATSNFARDEGIKCEAESHSEQDESLIVVCPPPFEFSPIRVKMVVGQIDRLGWEDVDLKKPTPVQVISGNKGGDNVLVRLPMQNGAHRWLAWRRFRKITELLFYQDQGAGAYKPNAN